MQFLRRPKRPVILQEKGKGDLLSGSNFEFQKRLFSSDKNPKYDIVFPKSYRECQKVRFDEILRNHTLKLSRNASKVEGSLRVTTRTCTQNIRFLRPLL